jgi:hypothetical protein
MHRVIFNTPIPLDELQHAIDQFSRSELGASAAAPELLGICRLDPGPWWRWRKPTSFGFIDFEAERTAAWFANYWGGRIERIMV